jgi:hypothetical protein
VLEATPGRTVLPCEGGTAILIPAGPPAGARPQVQLDPAPFPARRGQSSDRAFPRRQARPPLPGPMARWKSPPRRINAGLSVNSLCDRVTPLAGRSGPCARLVITAGAARPPRCAASVLIRVERSKNFTSRRPPHRTRPVCCGKMLRGGCSVGCSNKACSAIGSCQPWRGGDAAREFIGRLADCGRLATPLIGRKTPSGSNLDRR